MGVGELLDCVHRGEAAAENEGGGADDTGVVVEAPATQIPRCPSPSMKAQISFPSAGIFWGLLVLNVLLGHADADDGTFL